MTTPVLSREVEAYSAWKAEIAKELRTCRLWQRRNHLSSLASDQHLQQLQDALRTDSVTIAFAGEFSRGKTELINALFFSGYGQRILPSMAGRTTMCPTELFFDRDNRSSYLRLLPIETRLSDVSLAELRNMPGQWVDIPLTPDHPAEMARAMLSITETKQVPEADAIKLGFKIEQLDRDDDDPTLVEIPAWRHALVSFPHPLLQQGLRLLDTPGLNALGAEPELTLSLLPQAQAVVFVLAADQGVTASDLEIWNAHIAQLRDRPNLGLYAVLNKVDTLWDELDSRKKIEKALARVVRHTARQLDVDEKHIIPLSAKQGLLARVRDDQALLLRSQILDLEKVLSDAVIGPRRHTLWENIIADAGAHVETGLKLLAARREQLLSQRQQMERSQDDSQDAFDDRVHDALRLQNALKRSLLAVQPSQRLIERQANILLDLVSPEAINTLVERTQKRLAAANTSMGLLRAMREFFTDMDTRIGELSHQADMSNRMAEAVYRKFENEYGLKYIEPRLLPARGFRRRLQEFLHDADQLPRQMQVILNFETVAVRRFFNTSVAQVMQFVHAIRRELLNWAQNVLTPLTQQLSVRKQTLEEHLEGLQALQRNSADAAGRIKALGTLVLDVDDELVAGKNLLQKLRVPAPSGAASDVNVVAFSRLRR